MTPSLNSIMSRLHARHLRLLIELDAHRSLLGAADSVARYGGEEFICLLPDTQYLGAMHIAQLIVNAVQALHIEHLGSSFQEVTISAGVASMQPHRHLKWQTLIESADKQLYLAKEHGRNQVSGVSLLR